MPGFVSLIGAGPGDEGLITLRGAQRLAEADVIVYDALANPRLLVCTLMGPLVFAGSRLMSDLRYSAGETRPMKTVRHARSNLASRRTSRLGSVP